MSMEGYAWYSCISNDVFNKRATNAHFNGIVEEL